jgi:hypothetical protein
MFSKKKIGRGGAAQRAPPAKIRNLVGIRLATPESSERERVAGDLVCLLIARVGYGRWEVEGTPVNFIKNNTYICS